MPKSISTPDDASTANKERQVKGPWKLVDTNRKRTIFALAAALVIHEPVHEGMQTAYSAASEYYQEWKKEREEARQKARMMNRMKPELRTAYQEDVKAVAEINEDRLKRIEERKADAERFKQQILDNPDGIDVSTIFFPLEYYSQGVEEDEMRVAREVFRIKSDEIVTNSVELPHQGKFKEMVDTFMPPGSHSVIRSSAVYTLAHNLGPETQSCVARARLMAMEVATKYPELADYIYFQQFGDHIRALVEVDGNRHILEGPVAAFPDKLTDTKRSAVMPLKVWLQIYAGADKADFQDQIEYYGPPADPNKVDFARTTDNLVGGFSDPTLGNVGSADSWYNNRGNGGGDGVRDGSTNVEQAPEAPEDGISLLNRPQESEHKPEEAPEKPENQTFLIDATELTLEKLETYTAEVHATKTHRGGQREMPIYRELRFENLQELDKAGAQALLDWIAAERQMSTSSDNMLNTQLKSIGNHIHRLEFPVLSKMSGEAAKIIASMGKVTVFEGMNSLETEVAEGLSHTRTSLEFRNLRLLSAEAAAALVGDKKRQEELLIPPEMPKLEDMEIVFVEFIIPEEEEESVEGSQGGDAQGGQSKTEKPKGPNERYRRGLKIHGLMGLSEEAGEELGAYFGNLSFEECQIGEGGARGLAKRDPRSQEDVVKPGSLVIRVKEVPESFYVGIAGHRGELFVLDPILSENAAMALMNHPGKLNLNTVNHYEGNALSAILSSNSESIELGGSRFKQMPADGIALIGHRDGELKINHHIAMDMDVVTHLANHRGILRARGIEELTEQQAMILSKHQGDLYLDGVDWISVETARIMATMPGILSFGAKNFDQEVVEIFRGRAYSTNFSNYLFMDENGVNQTGLRLPANDQN